MLVYIATFLRAAPAYAAVIFALTHHYALPALLLALSVVCDGIFGMLKKRFACRDNLMQSHLEGLTDFFAFGVCPAMFCILAAPGIIVYAAAFVFLCAGIFRIARFNCEGLRGGYYRGLPITYNGYIVPCVYFFARGFHLELYLTGIFSVMLAIVSVLMVSSAFKVKEVG